MAITNFVPEVWSAQLLVTLKNSLVYGGPGIVNRDYEGEIANFGDTVNVNSISVPDVATYTAHTDITFGDVDDSMKTLTIDQAKYFAFEVDDIEKRQARADVMATAASEAAYKLADAADTFMATTLKAGVLAGNKLTAVVSVDATKMEQALIDLGVKLDENNVPSQGRWVVISPALHGVLLRSDLFVPADASGSTEALRNGQIGRAFGFDILKSNKVPAGASGTLKTIVAGHRMAASYAEQIAKTEAVRLEKRFADGLKGLHLYGAKVFRGEALASIDLTTAGA